MTGRGAPAQEPTRSITRAQCNILSTQLPVCMVNPIQQSYPFITYNCASHTCPFRWLSPCTQTYPSVNLSEIKNQQLRTGLPVGSDVVVTTTSKLQYLFESFGVYTSMRQPLSTFLSTVTAVPNRGWLSVQPFPCQHWVGRSVCATAAGKMAAPDGRQCEPVFVTVARALPSLRVLPDTTDITLRASLSGTFLQTLPDLVTQ